MRENKEMYIFMAIQAQSEALAVSPFQMIYEVTIKYFNTSISECCLYFRKKFIDEENATLLLLPPSPGASQPLAIFLELFDYYI